MSLSQRRGKLKANFVTDPQEFHLDHIFASENHEEAAASLLLAFLAVVILL